MRHSKPSAQQVGHDPYPEWLHILGLLYLCLSFPARWLSCCVLSNAEAAVLLFAVA